MLGDAAGLDHHGVDGCVMDVAGEGAAEGVSAGEMRGVWCEAPGLPKVPPVVVLHEDQPVPDPPDQPREEEVQGFSAMILPVANISSAKAKA